MSNKISPQLADVFRRNLRSRLIALEMSQRDLAQAMGVTDASVSGLINGGFCPTLNKVDEVANSLHTNSLYLLTAVEPEGISEIVANPG